MARCSMTFGQPISFKRMRAYIRTKSETPSSSFCRFNWFSIYPEEKAPVLLVLQASPTTSWHATGPHCFRVITKQGCSQELHMSVNFAAGVFHSQTIRAGWLRSSSGHCNGCNLAGTWSCNRDAKCKSQMSPTNTVNFQTRLWPGPKTLPAFGHWPVLCPRVGAFRVTHTGRNRGTLIRWRAAPFKQSASSVI